MFKKILSRMALAILPAAIGCTTTSTDCTAIGCGPAFLVQFERTGAWSPGNYRVTVVADGETVECTATLPLDCEGPPPCPSSAGFLVALNGCALDPSQHSITGVEFFQGSAPQSVEVRVYQDDVLLGEDRYFPSYTESQPNGPDCEPVCKNAEIADLALQ